MTYYSKTYSARFVKFMSPPNLFGRTLFYVSFWTKKIKKDPVFCIFNKKCYFYCIFVIKMVFFVEEISFFGQKLLSLLSDTLEHI
jgi:hypothetical protein